MDCYNDHGTTLYLLYGFLVRFLLVFILLFSYFPILFLFFPSYYSLISPSSFYPYGRVMGSKSETTSANSFRAVIYLWKRSPLRG